MTTAKYRWQNPHDWLMDKAQTGNVAELYSIIGSLAWRLDADSIQELFQEEMDRDGYFTPKEEA